jgi:glycogen synthase
MTSLVQKDPRRTKINPRLNDWGEWSSPAGVTYHRRDLEDDLANVANHLNRQQKSQVALRDLFSRGEVETLLNARRSISTIPGERTVVFLSYENPWGSSGGVLAVMRMAPDALLAEDERVVRLSPFHAGLRTKIDLKNPDLAEAVARCKVPVGEREVEVTVYRCRDPKAPQSEWYLMSAPGYFQLDGGFNGTEPYFHSGENAEDRDGPHSLLLRDSLFASAAVPHVLRALGVTRDIVIDAQDWQFAPVAQFALEAQLPGSSGEPLLKSAAVLLTLHNPYDHGLPRDVLAQYTHKLGSSGVDTVLQRMIPLTAGPVATVSGGFAQSLMQSPLQRFCLADHLQHTFASHGLFGITNGSLAPMREPFTKEVLVSAAQGDFDPIRHEKYAARIKALQAIAEHQKNESNISIGRLFGGNASYVGGDITNLDPHVPIVVCYGRFDLGQKGIDVFVDAIRQMPKLMARYVLISWPGSGDRYVQDHFGAYQQLADERAGEFLFLPERFSEFEALAAGATYVVYPSLYEPFGAVPDALTRGTGVVYHAVDGLLHQLLLPSQKLYIPSDVPPEQVRYAAPHIPVVGYHEGIPEGFDLRGETQSLQGLTDPDERREHQLFRLLSNALKDAMTVACRNYSTGAGEAYWRGLGDLPSIPKDWKTNARSRQAWYAAAVES